MYIGRRKQESETIAQTIAVTLTTDIVWVSGRLELWNVTTLESS
jgi:hypothetical protein